LLLRSGDDGCYLGWGVEAEGREGAGEGLREGDVDVLVPEGVEEGEEGGVEGRGGVVGFNVAECSLRLGSGQPMSLRGKGEVEQVG
jgi:hypothetical protein